MSGAPEAADFLSLKEGCGYNKDHIHGRVSAAVVGGEGLSCAAGGLTVSLREQQGELGKPPPADCGRQACVPARLCLQGLSEGLRPGTNDEESVAVAGDFNQET